MTWIQNNKKTAAGGALVLIVAIILGLLSVFNPQPVVGSGYDHYYASFADAGTWTSHSVTSTNNNVTTGKVYINGTQSVGGGNAKYMNISAIPSAMTDWGLATAAAGADYVAFNDTTHVVTLSSQLNFSLDPSYSGNQTKNYSALLLMFFVPATTYSVYSTTANNFTGNCTNGTRAVNMSAYVWNWTSSAWTLVNYSSGTTQQTLNLSIVSVTDVNGLKNGGSLYYIIMPNTTDTNCTYNYTGLGAVSYTTLNYTLNFTNSTTESSLNCSLVGTNSTGDWIYDYVYWGKASHYFTSKEFYTVASVSCNKTPSGALNLSNNDGSAPLVSMTTAGAYGAWVANSAVQSNNVPPYVNGTSGVSDTIASDIDAGSKSVWIACSGTATGFVEYADDTSLWSVPKHYIYLLNFRRS